MPVVVNEFEVVPAPERDPAAPAAQAPAQPQRPEVADEVERQLRRRREMWERLHAD